MKIYKLLHIPSQSIQNISFFSLLVFFGYIISITYVQMLQYPSFWCIWLMSIWKMHDIVKERLYTLHFETAVSNRYWVIISKAKNYLAMLNFWKFHRIVYVCYFVRSQSTVFVDPFEAITYKCANNYRTLCPKKLLTYHL